MTTDFKLFDTMYNIAAHMSNDEKTHVGAVILSPEGTIISVGANSLTRGVPNTPEVQERPEKYYWFEHAERNAIFEAAKLGIPLEGSVMYTNGIPCVDCARAIVQSGIKEVVYDELWGKMSTSSTKYSDTSRSKEILEYGGVYLRKSRSSGNSVMFRDGNLSK